MPKREIYEIIIDALLDAQQCTAAELTQHAHMSRSSIFTALSYLKDVGIIDSAPQSSYRLSDSLAFMLLKMHASHAELVAYSHQSELSRTRIDPLYSLSPSDNEIFFAQKAFDILELLEESFKTVIPCIIRDNAPNRLTATPNFFSISAQSSELISRSIAFSHPNKSVLYINNSYPLCILCRNGEPISTMSSIPSSLDSAIEQTLTLIKPDALIFEGNVTSKLETICKQSGVALCTPTSDRLYIDEKSIIVSALLNKIKNKKM